MGYLDWATQPNPFRRYDGAPLTPLLIGPRHQEPAYDSLFTTDGIAPQPVTRRTLSAFFECSLALSAWKAYGESTWALRCNPSSGNLHPTEGYLLCGGVEGIGEQPAAYHYAAKEHALERRHVIDAAAWADLVAALGSEVFFVGLSSILWREAWKYGERAFRYCQQDTGHALACLRFAAAMLGWRMTLLEDLGDDEVARLLGLDRVGDFSGAEREEPELFALVSAKPDANPRGVLTLDPDIIARVAAGPWEGRANRLSSDHVPWEIIDMVTDATRKPRTPINGEVIHPGRLPAAAQSAGTVPLAREVILKRRSATDFDGQTSIPRDVFYSMLARVMPTDAAPFDAISWPPAIHLLMFVHLVEGLSPGLYALVRDPAKVDSLRAATNPDFAWTLASDAAPGLPLYPLRVADCRRGAAQLSLGQAIAGDGAFSFGMVAEFEPSLRRYGPWFYRRLFWEAGMIGQTLYLEAEAAAMRLGNTMRATGIGAYFDDPVHEVFGLSGREFQSMYHFTMGGAVDDPRLTTRPPYGEAVAQRV
ncbi:MAG TPA: SagB/ThcOx family dehydrogenase [Phycisphaerae bacterium]|nr:SagB/ThcOx family dehydrogenase [Phycisphaerae bacterium]